ncbi:hypothetical protein PCASD_06444 [Puccinia coronata f. sp. avenae]|uniref:tripeptidyl-peptidase II n=2 Tax=Puccinia coronata f. sp. avenae TaxID=200324 RepID=A0A2N5UFN1_9BASI|nr:hypothetical protein PCASD_06444 [Puccinia coronata f. sp. avenae]
MITISTLLSFVLLSFLSSFLIASPLIPDPRTRPSFTGFRLFETHQAPKSFTKRQIDPSHKHSINLSIGLKSNGIEVIKKRLIQSSDPLSASYGQHITHDEYKQLSTPPQATLNLVTNWLSSHGLSQSEINWSDNKDWVTIKELPLRKAEEMLNTTYSYYQHNDDGEILLRTESYSLPHQLHSHVELVQPTTMFGRLTPQKSMQTSTRATSRNVRKHKLIKSLKNQHKRDGHQNAILPLQSSSSSSTSACRDPFVGVTNACLRQLYKTDSYRLKIKGKKNKIGVTAYTGQSANFEDLNDFLTHEGLPSTNNFTVISVNGGFNSQNFTSDQIASHLGVEANLDIQTTMGFTAPMPNVFYSIAGTPPFKDDLFTTSNSNEPYLDWLMYMSSQPDSAIPQVISTSYGDDEQTVPIRYAERVCNELAALGARGVSLIFSSGDEGVGQDGTCVSNDGKNTTKFIPVFPASCPYVTAVGATQRFHPEEAVSVDGPGGFTSGGGFSDYFERPDYQSNQVESYLNFLGSKYTGLYNRRGRAFPDVSAQGAKYLITWQGMHVHVGGSSASAPTFSSVIALLNDDRLSRGLPALGFLNPWLYSQGYKGLNDITIGSSSGCGTTGFAATKGWDPVTGLGTPDFTAMQGVMVTTKNSTSTSDVNPNCNSSLFSSLGCIVLNYILFN